MPVKLPSNAPESPADNPVESNPPENKFDPFRPEMPQIPGVGQGSLPERRTSDGPKTQRLIQIGGMAAAVVLVGALLFWWMKSKPRGAAEPASDADVSEQQAPAPPLPSARATVPDGPTVAATLDELSKPWAAKKFTFVKPITQENIDAMVIRLPGGDLWAFSLQGPAGRCELEFVTDLATLASKYRYNAGHPMVVSPCDSTVYDPLKIGALGGNTWVRGEIVHGSSLRPPISIDVKVRGRDIIADSIE